MADTAAAITALHRNGAQTPEETIKRCYARIAAHSDRAMFITLRDQAEAIAEARALPKERAGQPLYGVPVAVKDNIDVAGMPTTAACPAFTYMPKRDATSRRPSSRNPIRSASAR